MTVDSEEDERDRREPGRERARRSRTTLQRRRRPTSSADDGRCSGAEPVGTSKVEIESLVRPVGAAAVSRCRSSPRRAAGRQSPRGVEPSTPRPEEEPPHDRHPDAPARRTADRSGTSCGSVRMARRRPSTRFCSASSLSPSSSRSSSCRNVLRELFSDAASSVSNAPTLPRRHAADDEHARPVVSIGPRLPFACPMV